MAEWSKALVLGTSPKGRGFESHRCHIFFLFYYTALQIQSCTVYYYAIKTNIPAVGLVVERPVHSNHSIIFTNTEQFTSRLEANNAIFDSAS